MVWVHLGLLPVHRLCSFTCTRTPLLQACPASFCPCPAGWFEFIWDYTLQKTTDDKPVIISEADAEGKHVVDPYTYSLKFYKPSAGSM